MATFKAAAYRVNTYWLVVSKRIPWIGLSVGTVVKILRALVDVDADITASTSLHNTVSVTEGVAGSTLVQAVVSVISLAVTFVIPKLTSLRHTVGTLVTGVLAGFADSIRIADAKERSYSIDTTFCEPTRVTFHDAFILVLATLGSSMV